MYKVRKVKFIAHPVLKNMEIDFVGVDGRAVDTVIIAPTVAWLVFFCLWKLLGTAR